MKLRTPSLTMAAIAISVVLSAQSRQQATTGSQAQAAEKAIIQGTVLRAGTGQALKRARVSLNRQGQAQGPGQGRAALQNLNPNGGAGQVQQILQSLIAAPSTTAITDDSGRFVFNGVEPGQYRISVSRDGYVRQEYGQRSYTGPGTILNVGVGQRLTNIDFQMVPGGSISGRVFNEDGEPLADVQIQADIYQYQQGKRVLVPTGQSMQTNDLGEYRIYWLTPGEYYVSATARRGLIVAVDPVVTQQAAAPRGQRGGRGQGAPPAQPDPASDSQNDEAYAPTYFPGTTSPESATAITLSPAAEIRGIDFNLRPTLTAKVRGQVLVPLSAVAPAAAAPPATGQRRGVPGGRGGFGPGGRGSQINVMLTRIDSGGRGRGFAGGINRTNVRQDGTFEISGVVPGSYNLMAVARQDGQQYSGRLKIEVNESGVDNLTIPLRAGIPVPGKIYLDGTPPSNFKLSQLRVNLQPTENLQFGGGGNSQVADDGTFTLQNVSPMEYRVRVAGLPTGAYLMAGRIGSDDAVNQPFTINGDQQVALQLQIGFSAGHVSGTVIDGKGNPYQGALATLVPDPARRLRTDVYFSVPTDQYGRFSFPNVPPGSYKLFAWEDIPNGAYQDLDFIRRFEDRGQAVKLDASASTDVQVTVIPAQP
jgi:Carboxypeptidase regulatory-like domain/Polysaccharide lyase family 4, domain II